MFGRRLFAIVIVLWAGSTGPQAWPQSAPTVQPVPTTTFRLAQQRHALDQAFREQLHSIADECRQQGMMEQAALTEHWLPIRDPDRQYVFLPTSADPWMPKARASKETKQWYDQFLATRVAYAAQLFPLVQPTVTAGDAAQAYQLLHEILVHDPDHADVRRILGYSRNDQLEWSQSARRTTVTQPRRRQKTMQWGRDTYWKARSPHFEIYSTAGEDACLTLARHLERWHLVWRQVFFEYWSSGAKLNHWLDGKNTDKVSRKIHTIFLFSDRQQYLNDLSEMERIGLSTGYYDGKKTSELFLHRIPCSVGDVATRTRSSTFAGKWWRKKNCWSRPTRLGGRRDRHVL